MRRMIKVVGKYADGILTIITEDILYFFCLGSGDYWRCRGIVTPEVLEELMGQCDKYYIFDPLSFKVVERREVK